MGQTEEGADSRRQNEEGEKDSEGGISFFLPTHPPAMSWKNNGFSEALCRQGSSEKN